MGTKQPQNSGLQNVLKCSVVAVIHKSCYFGEINHSTRRKAVCFVLDAKKIVIVIRNPFITIREVEVIKKEAKKQEISASKRIVKNCLELIAAAHERLDSDKMHSPNQNNSYLLQSSDVSDQPTKESARATISIFVDHDCLFKFKDQRCGRCLRWRGLC